MPWTDDIASVVDPTDVTVTALLLAAVVAWAREWVVTAASCERRVAELGALHDARLADMRAERDSWRHAYDDLAAGLTEARRQDAQTGGAAADVLRQLVELVERQGDTP